VQSSGQSGNLLFPKSRHEASPEKIKDPEESASIVSRSRACDPRFSYIFLVSGVGGTSLESLGSGGIELYGLLYLDLVIDDRDVRQRLSHARCSFEARALIY
jgi:hypothetical protein